MNTMNATQNIVLYSALAVVMASCGSGKEETAQLTAKRDSLIAVKQDVESQLKSVEASLAALDTTQKERITPVTTLALAPAVFEHFFVVQGVVETDQNAQIYPEANGRITSIAVKEGQQVSKGQVLMTIDSRIVTNQIQELKARLSLAKTVFEKQESLWKQEIGSEIQYLEAKNNYESLQENLETLQAQQALYTITAPFDGVVDEIMPKEGEMASPVMPAVRLINMSKAYVKADVTEGYLGKIKAGDSVDVFFPGLGIEKASTIERIGKFINPANRTFKVRLSLENGDAMLRPNLLGELKIRDYKSDSAVVIPSDIIQLTPSGEAFVYRLAADGQSAEKVMITTGKSYDHRTEILTGLQANDVLIDKGSRSIKDGDVVHVVS